MPTPHRLSLLPCLTVVLLSCGGSPGDGGTVQNLGPSSISGVVSSPGTNSASVPGGFRLGRSWWTDAAQVALRQAGAGASSSGVVPGEYIVRLREGFSAQSLGSLSVPGQSLKLVAPIGPEGMGLYRSQAAAGPLGVQSVSADAVLSQLAARPDVLYAEPNRWWHAQNIPNDKNFPFQWGAQAMNLPAAWDLSTGKAIAVAVVDTGIVAHPDLSSKLLPGYDFVSDLLNAGDGNGPDADPTDLGGGSDYHGSHVAGIIAAATNNTVGVAGVSWGARVVPVRVLGKDGGGTVADILMGLRWAAGLNVPGVPTNPNPARVVNLSLGGDGGCSKAEQDVFDQLAAAGVVTVVAAGNANVDASTSSPANCSKVIAVGATGPDGKRAYYSNFGARIDVMAPGGNSSVLIKVGNQQVPGGILSTVKNDTTTPATYDYAFYEGTSQAAPQVAGVAALLLSTQPTLTPPQVLAQMRANAHPLNDADCGAKAGCGGGVVDAAATLKGSPVPVQPPPPVVTVQVQTLVAGLYIDASKTDKYDLSRSVAVLLDQKTLRNPYSLNGAVAGSYTVVAWQDLNGNEKVDVGEPFGVYKNSVVVDTVARAFTGVDVDLKPLTAASAAPLMEGGQRTTRLTQAMQALSLR
jgi:serine protease